MLTGQRSRQALVLALYICVSLLYVRPLFSHLGTHLAVDAGDPALNAAVLWWNATVVPFTAAWWNQPWFHPVTGVTTFTENLTGLWAIATPIYWLTGSPAVTYNLTFFATWPLSAFAMYLLVRRLTGRTDAGIVAGFAFAFTPYRASAALGHLQALSVFWLPIALLALHAYLQDRRRRWLVAFGVAWLLQSLANGYYLFFGAVLIALWLAYFGSTRSTWRGALAATGAWVVASLPLVPVLLQYQRVHEQYGLHRTAEEAEVFSAHLDSFTQVSDLVRVWSQYLQPGKEMLFPGITALGLVVVAGFLAVSRPRRRNLSGSRDRALLIAAALIASASLAAIAWYLVQGRWSLRVGGALLFTMSDSYRAVLVLTAATAVLLWKSQVTNAIAGRRPFPFYAAATFVMAVLACGPVMRSAGAVVLDPSPYRWLMALPGFGELRVPSRFWMMGVLCLSVAAGLGYAALTRARETLRYALCAIVSVGLLAEGWLKAMPIAAAPAVWTSVDGADSRLPLLELPLGPRWDNAATFRTTAHGRRVFNGVSGYDPPHYPALEAGLRARDPAMLAAIASLGAYEITIERANDPDGAWERYATGAAGARVIARNDQRVLVRIPDGTRIEPVSGAALAIASVRASQGDASVLVDGRDDTYWVDSPQRDSQWLLADLGGLQEVGGVSLAIRDQSRHFPRALAIDTSVDGAAFTEAWAGTTAPATFLAVLNHPRDAWLRVAFSATAARFVRIRQTGRERVPWVVAALEINAPAR